MQNSIMPAAGDTWRHRKGDIYTVIDVTSEPDAGHADKFPVTVFYRGADGRKWTRTLESWRESFVFEKSADGEQWVQIHAKELESLKHSLDFYRRRVELLQRCQQLGAHLP